MLTTVLGLCASLFTTVSYVPQLIKAWQEGGTRDLSLKMLLILLCGLLLWVAYGVLRDDLVIIIANAVSATLLTVITVLKVRGS